MPIFDRLPKCYVKPAEVLLDFDVYGPFRQKDWHCNPLQFVKILVFGCENEVIALDTLRILGRSLSPSP